MAKYILNANEDPMSAMCSMVLETKYDDLPEEVVDAAKRSILDTVGVMIGGSAMESIPEVVSFVRERGGKGESLLPFYGGKYPASLVGLAIGPTARAMDLGQVHEEAGHCSEYIVAALLAALGLKERTGGRELITAFVVGQEMLIRIGNAYQGVSKGIPLGRGTGQFIFGAVAAVGKLLGLGKDELENAEGIARGMTGPHDLAMYNPSTSMVRLHHGFVCRDAIDACLLGRKGLTGSRREVLSGPMGFLGFAKWQTAPDALTYELGDVWEMTKVSTKLYACCKGAHTAIQALLRQMSEQDFRAEDIDHIEVDECSRPNWSLVCAPRDVKWNPQTVAACQFSLPYVMATAAYTGGVFVDAYVPEAMTRKDVRNLMTRITAREAPRLTRWAARVKTTLKNGNVHTNECIHVYGDYKNPLSNQDLIHKFKKCIPYSAFELNDDVTNRLISILLTLEQTDDVTRDLILPLTPPDY